MEDQVIQFYNKNDPLSPASKPELIFGIIAPAGTDRNQVISEINSEMQEYGYTTHHIKISELIKNHEIWKAATIENEAQRIEQLMDLGNEIRKRSKLADAMAIMAISKIVDIRRKSDSYYNHAKSPNAYIIDSLKNPKEISSLRAVYGSGFSLISIYSDREHRVKNLSERIARSKFTPGDAEKSRSDAEKIISRDDQEEDHDHGQNVQGCFPKADLFLNIDQPHKELKNKIDRFLQIVFNNPFITPTRDECGMFHAEANSWRSADLSRQVGAAICSEGGDVLALGCNEVPKAHGGLYWEGDEEDARDFQKGNDKGGEHKRMMVAEIIRRLSDDEETPPTQRTRFNELIRKALEGEDDNVLKGLQALNVIEYGRTVHAEMAALTDAARRGISVQGSVMYVNTFPCHICARHIISAGIKRLVYIEPYPKSLTLDLFSDSIVIGKGRKPKNKISFEPFTGVAPRQYQTAFQLGRKRKIISGDINRWNKKDANTKLKRYVTSYLAIEHGIVAELLPKIMRI